MAEPDIPLEPLEASFAAGGIRLPSWVVGLAAAVATVALALLIRYAIQPWLDGRAPLILFTISVLACGIYFGRGAAAVAAILSFGAGALIFLEDGVLNAADAVHLAIYFAVC